MSLVSLQCVLATVVGGGARTLPGVYVCHRVIEGGTIFTKRDGIFPGATFIAERERPVVVRFVNRLDDIASLHHDRYTPPDSEGMPASSYDPASIILPAWPYPGARTYELSNDDRFPATQWHHDRNQRWRAPR